MSIEKFRDWFELIALVAVVGSLIAVVVELRQTQTAMQASVYQARAFNGIEYNWELAKDESMRMLQEYLYSEEFDPLRPVIQRREQSALNSFCAIQSVPSRGAFSQRLVSSMSSFIASPVCGRSSAARSRWFSGDSSTNWSNTGRTTSIG